MRRLLHLVLTAVLLLLCGATPPPQPHTVLAATPISRMDLHWWRARHEAKLEELRSRRVDLIFLGDSLTQDYEVSGPPEWRDFVPVWQRFYGDRNAVNLGFNGDATSHLLWRIENGEVAGIAPKVAVILIGANNLGRLHWSAEDTVAGIDAIVTQLRQPPAAHQAAAAGRSAVGPLRLGHRDDAGDQPGAGGAIPPRRRCHLSRYRSGVHAGTAG